MKTGGESVAHKGVAKDSSGYGVAHLARAASSLTILVGSGRHARNCRGAFTRAYDAPHSTAATRSVQPLEDAVTAAVKARKLGAAASSFSIARSRCRFIGCAHSPVAALAAVPSGTEAVLLAEVEDENDKAAAFAARGAGTLVRRFGSDSVKGPSRPTEQHEIWELRHAASPILRRVSIRHLKSMQFIEDGAVPAAHLG